MPCLLVSLHDLRCLFAVLDGLIEISVSQLGLNLLLLADDALHLLARPIELHLDLLVLDLEVPLAELEVGVTELLRV